jgi:hypothetical protein
MLGDKVYVFFDFQECSDCDTVLFLWFCGQSSGEEDMCLCYLSFCSGGRDFEFPLYVPLCPVDLGVEGVKPWVAVVLRQLWLNLG